MAVKAIATVTLTNYVIGGRNLLLDSKKTSIWYCPYGGNAIHAVSTHTFSSAEKVNNISITECRKATVATGGTGDFRYTESLILAPSGSAVDGQTYTLSAWVRSDVSTWGQIVLSRNDDTDAHISAKVDLEPNVWTKMCLTKTFNNSSRGTISQRIRFSFQSVDANIYISLMKLELGSFATDWTPAPEDMETRVTKMETEIESNKEAITLRATKTEVTAQVGVLDGKITTAQNTANTATTKADNAQNTANAANTKATNAQNDIDKSTDNLSKSIKEMQASITETANSIKSEVNEKYISIYEHNTKIQELTTQIEQLSNRISIILSEAKSYTNGKLTNSNGDGVQDQLNAIFKKIDITLANGITIGQSDSPYKSQMDNDRFAITYQGKDVFYAQNGKLYSPKMEVTDEIDLLGFKGTINGNAVSWNFNG